MTSERYGTMASYNSIGYPLSINIKLNLPSEMMVGIFHRFWLISFLSYIHPA